MTDKFEDLKREVKDHLVIRSYNDILLSDAIIDHLASKGRIVPDGKAVTSRLVEICPGVIVPMKMEQQIIWKDWVAVPNKITNKQKEALKTLFSTHRYAIPHYTKIYDKLIAARTEVK